MAVSARPRWPRNDPPKRAKDLMATALELFARQDFTSVTIKDIAHGLRVNTALIYYYFESKDELFRATLEYCIENALRTFRELEQRHRDPVRMITAWFSTQARLAPEIRQLLKIMLDYSTSTTSSRIADAAIRRFYDEEIKILSTGFRLGIRQNVFRPVNVTRTAQIASTYLDGIMARSLIHKTFDVKAAIGDLQQILWNHLGYSSQGRRGGPAARRRQT
jgi:TetR/AcrR family transcriptional regulator, upper aerobic nicotinate degradation pathway regulator